MKRKPSECRPSSGLLLLVKMLDFWLQGPPGLYSISGTEADGRGERGQRTKNGCHAAKTQTKTKTMSNVAKEQQLNTQLMPIKHSICGTHTKVDAAAPSPFFSPPLHTHHHPHNLSVRLDLILRL